MKLFSHVLIVFALAAAPAGVAGVLTLAPGDSGTLAFDDAGPGVNSGSASISYDVDAVGISGTATAITLFPARPTGVTLVIGPDSQSLTTIFGLIHLGSFSFPTLGPGIYAAGIFSSGGELLAEAELTLVPEPHQYAAAACVGLLGFGLWRRWQQR